MTLAKSYGLGIRRDIGWADAGSLNNHCWACWNLECVVKLDEFCLARSCYLSKAKRERDSLAIIL